MNLLDDPMVQPFDPLAEALKLAAWAYQCRNVVYDMDRTDPNSTGFHTLAASSMADKAWKAFQTVVLEVADGDQDSYTLEAVTAFSESAGNILRARVLVNTTPTEV